MVNLTMKLATTAAEVLKDYPGGTDVEILERHHRFKEDSPSGTALRFGNLISNAMGISNEVHGREGQVEYVHAMNWHIMQFGQETILESTRLFLVYSVRPLS